MCLTEANFLLVRFLVEELLAAGNFEIIVISRAVRDLLSQKLYKKHYYNGDSVFVMTNRWIRSGSGLSGQMSASKYQIILLPASYLSSIQLQPQSFSLSSIQIRISTTLLISPCLKHVRFRKHANGLFLRNVAGISTSTPTNPDSIFRPMEQ